MAVMRVATFVVVVAALAVAGAARAENASPVDQAFALKFSSAEPGVLPQDVQAVALANAPLYTVSFADYAEGTIGENDELQAALRCAGIDAIDYVGVATVPQGFRPSEAVANALCPVHKNMASIVAPRGPVPRFSDQGYFYVQLAKPVRHLFVQLVDEPQQVQVTVQRGAVPTGGTMYNNADTGNNGEDNGAGTFALIAAQDGGEFDRVVIRALGDAEERDGFCVQSIGVPAREVGRRSGCSRNGLPDDDRRKRSIGELVVEQRKRAVAEREPPATIDVGVAPGTTLQRHDSPCGELCATLFDTYDEGFVFNQRPSRLDSDAVLKAIRFRGIVDGDPSGLNTDHEDREDGFHAFCGVGNNAGGVVSEELEGKPWHFREQHPGAAYEIELHGHHRTVLIDITGNPGDVGVSVALDGVAGGQQVLTPAQHWQGATGSPDTDHVGAGVITVSAADADGVFNKVTIVNLTGTGSDGPGGVCIAGVAVPCEPCT